jgi:hypothetical protein
VTMHPPRQYPCQVYVGQKSRCLVSGGTCYALLRMICLSLADAEGFVVISCGNVRISVRLYFIMSVRLIDATSILHCELEVPPV